MTNSTLFGRRNFLNGLGLAGFTLLPLVRAVMEAETAFGAPGDMPRLVIIPIQTGWGARKGAREAQTEQEAGMKCYFGADAQGNLTLPGYFSALAPFRAKMNVFDGFQGTWWGNAHDVSWSDYLTNSGVPGGDAFLPSTYESIDELVARAWGTRVIRAAQTGNWGAGLECWVRENGVVKKALQFRDPNAAFQSMAGLLPVSPGSTPTQAAKAYDRKRLLMDYVEEDLGKIRKRIPAEAFENLESHLSALAALQNKTGQVVPPMATEGERCFIPAKPGAFIDGEDNRATAATIAGTVKAHFEIIRAGLACGTHRVAMMSLPNGFGPIKPDDWEWIDTQGRARRGNIWSNNFHEDISHWDKPDRAEDTRRAFEGSIAVRVRWVADFVASLEAVKDADGTSLLDKTLVVLTGEIGDGSHETGMKNMITIGGGARIRTNRYVRMPYAVGSKWWPSEKKASLASLPEPFRGGVGGPFSLRTEGDWWMGVARALGVNLPSFGNPVRLWGRVDVS